MTSDWSYTVTFCTVSEGLLAAVLLIKTRHVTGGWYFCLEPRSGISSNEYIFNLVFEVGKEQTTSAKTFGVKPTVQT